MWGFSVELYSTPREKLSFSTSNLVLNDNDVHCFEMVFQGVGEFVVRDKNVNIFRSGKGIGLDFADFGAIQHHIHKFRFFADNA